MFVRLGLRIDFVWLSLKVNANKSETLVFERDQRPECLISFHSDVEAMAEFEYLGVKLRTNGSGADEVHVSLNTLEMEGGCM